MNNRRYNSELVSVQKKLRAHLLKGFYEFDISEVDMILAEEDNIISMLSSLIEATNEPSNSKFFKYYNYLIVSLFHLLKWGQKEMSAVDSSAHLKASVTNVKQIDLEFFNYITDFKTGLQKVCNAIEQVSEVSEIRGVLDLFMEIPFPTIFAFVTNSSSRIDKNDVPKDTDVEKVIVLSLEFSIDGDPWANPQVLKPEELYAIKGSISLNEWPEGFDALILRPVSTSNSDWYSLSLPEIKNENKTKYEIAGQVVFKYPQSTFDNSISIRLLGYFSNYKGDIKYPTIIGYDQLILKVLDPNSSYFVTGFKKMNKIVLEMANTINKELPEIDSQEKDNFLKLLSGILNYQGYCMQQGKYKRQEKVLEDTFRDDLIQHLIGVPYIGEEVSKEAHLAGGRIEIGYRGIIVELKVEYTISDRDRLYKKYGKQPIAYASGDSKQLAILCILDLTEKSLPPATPQNNIKLLTPEIHGFEGKELDFPSKLAMVIIDGNTKSPSDYSK